MHRPGLMSEGLVHLVTQRYSIALVTLVLLALAIAMPAAAAEITVNTVGEFYAAVGSAGDGDAIILNQGTYTLSSGQLVIMGKRLTIQANTSYGHGRTDTFIVGGGSDRLFYNSGPSLTIDNLTLQNGVSANGGAISNVGGTVTITSSTIAGCTASSGSGGAIYNHQGTVSITGSTITECTADLGGAIYSVNGGTVTITGSTISGCTSNNIGGAIYNDGTVTITGSTISVCTSNNIGGAIYNNGGVTITGSTISGCTAYNFGGAIYNPGGTVIIDSSRITGCTATTGDGGAIYSNNNGIVTIRNSSAISDCRATAGNGGAIFTSGSAVTITGSTFTNCSALNGGAISTESGGSLSITGSEFSGCTTTVNGGAISSSLPLTITSSTFTGNAAGAIGSAIYSTGSGSSVHFSRFYQNLHPVWGVVHSPTSIEAQNNWWGINDTPPTPGYVNEAPRLVLGATASPASITTAGISLITANLTFNFPTGADTSLSGHVPDGIPVACSLSGVSGTLEPLQGNTTSGKNTTTFRPATAGTAVILVTVDGESVPVTIVVTQGPPAIDRITPASGVNTSAVSITDLAGSSFMTAGTTTVNLTRTGHANITATGVTVTGPAHITCTLPITGAEAGPWDVVVVNPDGQEGVLADGFTIIAGVPTTVPTTASSSTASSSTGTSDNDDDYWGTTDLPLMTVTVNIGGDSKAWQAIVTGTKLTDLIITGTVQPDTGSNITAPPGIVFQYISLVPARFTSISKAVINFTVPQALLDENHIDPKSIVLYHQTANGWEALPTTVLYTKDVTVYFSAESAGFSLFAIAGTPGVTIPAPEVTAMTTQEIMSDIVYTPILTAAAEAPVTTQTTAPPAASVKPAAQSPLLNIILVIAAIGILAGGGFMVRRWWIRRQNPALFAEND